MPTWLLFMGFRQCVTNAVTPIYRTYACCRRDSRHVMCAYWTGTRVFTSCGRGVSGATISGGGRRSLNCSSVSTYSKG